MIVKNRENQEHSTVAFQVEVDAAEFEKAVNAAYLKAKKSIAIPGFRKGKAPRMIIEGMYGADVFYQDAVDEIAQAAFAFAVEQEKIDNVGRPGMKDYDVSDEKVLTLSFETAVRPEVTLGEYKSLEAPKAAASVTDEQVEAEVQSARNRASRIETVERPVQDGDTAVIDFEGFIDGVAFEGGKGESYSLKIGSGSFIPGFEEQVVGMSAGEERDIDVTFPEDYAAEMAGKAAVFHIKLHEVKETQLPEADDEFAKDVSEFDTLDEYKADIRARLLKTAEEAADRDFQNALIEKAIENMTVDVPDAMIQETADQMMQEYDRDLSMQGYSLEQYVQMLGMNMDAMRQSAIPGATKRTKTALLLDKVAEVEAVEVSQEDIDKEIADIAESYQTEVEKIKDIVDNAVLVEDLKRRKASKIITDSGVATEPVAEEAKTEESAEEKAD